MTVPRYIVKLNDRGYYSAHYKWMPVLRVMATVMTHEEAVKVRNKLTVPKLGYKPKVEKL